VKIFRLRKDLLYYVIAEFLFSIGGQGFMTTNFLHSPEWIEQRYLAWQKDPASVSAQWQAYFSGFQLGEVAVKADDDESIKPYAVQSLIYRYRDIGHLMACIDPLTPCPIEHPQLSLSEFGLDEADLDRTFRSNRFIRETATLREIIGVLRDTYCRSIGVEFMHIQDPEERQWLKDRMELCRNRPELTREDRLGIYRELLEATRFEAFLHKKFPGQKRFSLEGGETIIAALQAVIKRSSEAGVEDLVFGMSHRGRLNVLVNVFRKPLANMFAEFRDNVEFGFVGDGDVKYHNGLSTDISLGDSRSIHLTLAPNPSHLEAVDPVVEGKARARQDDYGKQGITKVLPVLMHGDAAFAGQGIVAEVFNLSQLEGYRTGGTLHLVLNNQIGFTTLPEDARSTLYATDVAKMLMVPIFHVNGEDPEAVVWAASLALEYRQRFGKDAVMEMLCFRKYGHNEGDEPNFTQPLMYERIRQRPPVSSLYRDHLIAEAVASEKELEAIDAEIVNRLNHAFDAQPEAAAGLGFYGKWAKTLREYSAVDPATIFDKQKLVDLGRTLGEVPKNFSPHPKVAKLLAGRMQALVEDEPLDWGNVETLCYATLLDEGYSVRISGQDSRRGTFNHRHAVLHDLKSEKMHVPLASLRNRPHQFQVYDSMLSEVAVLGFEYGYSLETPNGLVIWEAQFGDFANGAQVIIDQFIAGSSSKWDRSSGLVLFLPHGYEGQGAEHSSARIERYLQLCAEHNMFVVTPSTPAQLFHLLRRHVKLPFRRPLIVFTPKSLLRHPECVSTLDELATGRFKAVIDDTCAPKAVKRILLCSGKVYYDLLEEKTSGKHEQVAIVRIEQLYPLMEEQLEMILKRYPKKAELCWVQEEPANAGAWAHLSAQLEKLGKRPLRYIGRRAKAATAVGSHRLHVDVQKQLVAEAFNFQTD
jgi:2-oxoglutarate dehydrogenase E1 component